MKFFHSNVLMFVGLVFYDGMTSFLAENIAVGIRMSPEVAAGCSGKDLD